MMITYIYTNAPLPTCSIHNHTIPPTHPPPHHTTPNQHQQGKLRLGESKLVYDPRTGRFSEAQIEEICREEYCAIDEKTGQPILLSGGYMNLYIMCMCILEVGLVWGGRSTVCAIDEKTGQLILLSGAPCVCIYGCMSQATQPHSRLLAPQLWHPTLHHHPQHNKKMHPAAKCLL